MVVPAQGDEVLLVVRGLPAHHQLVLDVVEGHPSAAGVHRWIEEAGHARVAVLLPPLPAPRNGLPHEGEEVIPSQDLLPEGLPVYRLTFAPARPSSSFQQGVDSSAVRNTPEFTTRQMPPCSRAWRGEVSHNP